MNLLAFDTSTELLSAGVRHGERQLLRDAAGGRHASASLIPTVRALLAQAGLHLNQLDAIVFGCGPGSFTGLRTSCAVAQGLAFGAGVPVLPVNTLRAVAEQARLEHGVQKALTLLDARMDEIYAAAWHWQQPDGWQAASEVRVCAPEALSLPGADPNDWALCGNVFELYAARLPHALAALPRHHALPTAAALLSLAPALLRAGAAVAAEEALPIYARDNVAQTTAQRAAARAAP